jgi:hypothetical protein
MVFDQHSCTLQDQKFGPLDIDLYSGWNELSLLTERI